MGAGEVITCLVVSLTVGTVVSQLRFPVVPAPPPVPSPPPTPVPSPGPSPPVHQDVVCDEFVGKPATYCGKHHSFFH